MNQPGMPPPQYMLMPHPGAIPGVPEGLEYLAAVDQLIIKQEVELFEVLSGMECKNKYRVFNSIQQQVYYAYEESDTCNRICFGASRGFVLHITDNQQQEVLNIVREFRCCTGCCWCADGCCQYPMMVNDKAGRKLGMIRQMNSCCQLRFGIFDENDVPLYEIWAPCCGCQCVCMTEDVNFPICNISDKTQVGNIRKIWGGLIQEAYTKADTFGVSFPMDLLVKHKALMLAAIFLIDFAIFERQKKNNNR
ncbi:unnamed protein product [Candidula unifasciata]|uniref:Phospholipid scramblase n=1 Tax=Candidula unifasciata TaxID=100452 RepID=A0A8S3ZYF0_9EUPU|nr:unnamed protein product [Candidula unifasciata]